MIAAVTVLYNPQPDVILNIKTYIDYVDQLYLVDNSDTDNRQLAKLLGNEDKVVYISNRSNLGIATALNIGCRKAIAVGYKWIITMDQDSKVLNCDFSKVRLEENSDKVALYYPSYIINGDKYKYKITEDGKPLVVMTSGNIIDLEVFEKVNGFEDKLFIDYVDIDYCLKLKQNGYQLEEVVGYNLEHELGKSIIKKNRLFEVLLTNHPLIRRYYISRNKFYMLHKYSNIKTYYDKEKHTLLKEIIKIILFEEQKTKKLRVIYEGYRDFKLGNFGKKVL